MFKPYFQIKNVLAQHNTRVFSSNYTLYHDFQSRLVSIYRQHSEAVEIYSIDEAFLRIADLGHDRLSQWAVELRGTARQWTGITTGIGVGSSKLLAKLANHCAKRVPLQGMREGVCVLDSAERVDEALGRVDLKDLWGISRGSIRRLKKLGIQTPREFRDADPNLVRQELGVVGQRQVYELRGKSRLPLELIKPDRKNICCSRSFGKVTNRFDDLTEAVATFSSAAAVKLRRQNLVASKVTVFVQTDRHADVEQYANSRSVRLITATEDTRELIKAAKWCLLRVFRGQHHYKKAGVLLSNLSRREERQLGLYDQVDRTRTRGLMRTLDAINERHGRGAVRIGASSPFELRPCRTWHLRSDNRSPRYTTRWDELPVATVSSQKRHSEPARLWITNRLASELS